MYLNLLENLIVFFLPTQLGLHFWPYFSRVAGIKIDYLSPTIYFLDIFLILYFLANLQKLGQVVVKNQKWSIATALFIVANTIFSLSIPNTILWWIKIILYIGVAVALRQNKISWRKVRSPLLLMTSFVIILQILQLFVGHSLGGIFYFLGERAYSGSSTGLAHMTLENLDFVRPPSVFSHPNSLAGYLVIVYFLMNYFKSPLWQRLVVFLSLLLTASKAALLALALVVLLKISPLLIIYSSLIISVGQIFFVKYSSSFQFISDRLFLVAQVPRILKINSFFGVGLGNFVVALGNLLPGSQLLLAKIQPIHNIPYLILCELGITGVFLIGALIYKYRDNLKQKQVLKLLAIILVIGSFDHYFWTLPQNRLILLLALSLML